MYQDDPSEYTMRRGLDDVDETIGDPAYVAAKKRRQQADPSRLIAMLVIVVSLMVLALAIFNWVRAHKPGADRIQNNTDAINALGGTPH